jgi:hypothetical protein
MTIEVEQSDVPKAINRELRHIHQQRRIPSRKR